ncbi:PDZ domain-containing protein 2 [Salarias fasciatus]|uniref:PDZ domain-containing protein 2-like n=1 Tax=Salarias fasciatus TaxID=181472 RepID=A0A672J8U3_SALFA|nr:PDZ domain-containing protein 2-like [Salarias fasciatus]XP_029959239.1 PDZ domain-containing protein 2-like [Salarias fasciatus]
MDLSLLPSAVSQYKQRSRPHFTVRSASSPSYSLNRRPGLRKRETAVESGGSGRYGSGVTINPRNTEDTTSAVSTGSHRHVKDQCEEREPSGDTATVGLTQNITADQTVPETSTDQSENLPLEIRGRTELKRSNLVNRSKSVDWRTREKSPDRSTNADIPALSPKRDTIMCRRASSVMERRNEVEEHIAGRAHVSPTFPKCGSNSLPSRWRSLTTPDSKNTNRHPSLELTSGQSIIERIEKLLSSAGLGKTEEDNSVSDSSTDSQQKYGKTAGGTFPRRFSAGDFNCPVRSWMPPIWTQKENNKTLPSPPRSSSQERPLGSHWQGQAWTKHTDGGGVTWRKGFVDSGTRSLDRARSKNTIAAQIRAARATAGISSTQQPNDLSGEASHSDLANRLRERRASGSKIDSWVHFGDDKRDSYRLNGVMKERIGRVREEHKESDEDMKERNELKSSTLDEVFETSQKITLKVFERKKLSDKLPAASSASVKNKINQFEALTQNAQGSETNQVWMSRRTYSVPAQLSRLHDGVKKSTSAKDIDGLRHRSEGLKEGCEAGGRSMRTTTKFATGRSLSVDEVGLKLMQKESGERDAAMEVEGNVFDHYSKLKNTLEIPLNEGAQRKRRQFFIDEQDFVKVSSPEEQSRTSGTAQDAPSSQPPSDVSTGEKKRISSGPASPGSDNDKTPTNTPDHSPFIPPQTQQDATPRADSQNKSAFVFTQETNLPDPSDTPPLPGPLTTSSPVSLPDFIPPEVTKSNPRGRKQLLDLDAWITGLNPEFKGWNYDEEDSDESTEKDDDSNYDSDSGESSVTITSSQSDRKSFSVNLADLCNFTGTEYESDDSDDWQSVSRRSASLSSDVSALSYVSLMPAEELDQLLENVRSIGNNTLQDYNDVQVVVLHKDVGVGLGFSLAGGVDQSKPITVHKVFHSGVAAKEGSIREGDRVLSINGTALQDTAHWEALRVLRRAKTREMGVVVLKRDDATGPPKRGVQGKSQAPPPTQCHSGQRVCVQLQKNSRDLGFSLEGGADSSEGNRPLTVQKVFLGGPVDKVQSGDEVLEIQGRSVVGMRRLEAWTLIRTLPSGPVDVVLCRHPET